MACSPSTLLLQGKDFQQCSPRDLDICIAQLLCNLSSAAGAVTVTVSPSGIANGQSTITNNGAMFGPDTSGTTTSGIQEALNSLHYAASLGPQPGSGRVIFAPGVFEFAGQITLNDAYPLDLVWQGCGKVGTILKYTGTSNAIVDVGHANLPAPRLQFTVRDMGFAYLQDTTKAYLMRITDVNECRFERCLWTTWGSLTNNPYSTLNYIPTVPLAAVGVVGARIGQGADNQHVYDGCTFYGLAVGAWDNGDHVRFNNCMFANCGHNVATGYVNSYVAAVGQTENNVLSLGGAVVTSVSAFDDTWFTGCHFHFCNAALVVYTGSGAAMRDCIFEGTQYCTLTDADNYSIVIDDFTANNLCPNGDHLYTPNTGVIGGVSGVVTHWQQDVFSFGSMLDINVGGSSKFNISSAGLLTALSAKVSALTASRMVLSDASKILTSAAASGAVPINADGSATTAAQINALGNVGPGYVITFCSLGNNSMAAATTYFYGVMSTRTINTTYSLAQIDIPKSGTIKRVYYKIDISGTLGTAAQNVTHLIRINDTTDVASSAFDYSTAIINTLNSSVSQAVSAGDTIAFKVVTPGTWTTPATSVRLVAVVYIE